jgi:hypothetical protein
MDTPTYRVSLTTGALLPALSGGGTGLTAGLRTD